MLDSKEEEVKRNLLNRCLESIFLKRNPITKKNYDVNSKTYFLNYGSFIPKNKNIRILDIGCGMGHFLYALVKNGYRNFIGIDISNQMINFCKNYVKRTELKDSFQEISQKVVNSDLFTYLEKNQEQFDLIVANDLIEHIEKNKILNLFELIKHNLKYNGIFIVKTVNMVNPLSNRILYDDFTHQIGFTSLSLAQIYLVTGFKNVAVGQFIAKKPRFITRILRKITLKFLSEIFGMKEIKNWSPLIFGVGVKK